MTEAEIDNLYPEERLEPLTDKTITRKTELKLELINIRKTGVSYSWEASYEGVGAIASVIRDKTGKAIAAMSIAVPIFRKNQSYVDRLVKLVKMGSALVSYRLGFVDQNNPVTAIQDIRTWWRNNQ
jgi:DNA-binding IclR family transcriptional regulator